MSKKNIAIILILLLLITGCNINLNQKDTKIDEAAQYKQDILKEFEGINTSIPNAMNISGDSKKEEVLEFCINFLSSLSYPEIDGVPVRAERESFYFIGYAEEGANSYYVIVRFKLKSMKGKIDKQYTLELKDKGNNNYDIDYLREDK